jgi:hypothetical protein
MAIPKKLNKLKTWIIMNERFNQELILKLPHRIKDLPGRGFYLV